MKLFSGGKLLNSTSARNCFLVNQFATPGLGSLMGGRIVEGIGQLLVAILGFVFVIIWFLRTMQEEYSLLSSEGPIVSYAKIGLAGLLLFAAAWFWSLMTSISMMRQAKAEESKNSPGAPPRITNPPPKM